MNKNVKILYIKKYGKKIKTYKRMWFLLIKCILSLF